jgi:hypothetical protein
MTSERMADKDALVTEPQTGDAPTTGDSSRVATTSRGIKAIREWLGAITVDWQDTLIVAGLLALFSFVHRRLEVVEFGGDAVAKWQFARQWWHHFDWAHADLDHHSGRMGVNVVAFASQALFGRGWKTYYVAPFFVMMLQLPFMYAIGKRLVNAFAGVLGVLLLTYLSTMHRSASQLLPDGFAGAYAIITTYLYLRFADPAESNKRGFLIGMGIAAFVGYLAKETFFFFFPGMVIAVWMARKSLRDVITFLGVMFAGFLLETAMYASFTKYPSRYQVVRSVHGSDGLWPEVKFTELFDRFSHLHDGWKYLLFFSLASGLWLLASNRHERKAGQAVALIGFSQLFMLTFFVRGFDPIELWERFEPRYIEPFAPFAAVMSGAFLGHVATELWSERSWPQWVRRFGPASSVCYPFWALALLLAVGFTGRWLGGKDRGPAPFSVGRKLAKLGTNAYQRNLPLAIRRVEKPKMLAVLYDVYLSDELLVRNGHLPNLQDVARIEGPYTYLVKNPAQYTEGKFAKMLSAGCILDIYRSRGTYELSSWDPLPAKCDRLLKE